MQRSMEKMAVEMQNGSIRQMQLAKRLRDEVEEENPEVQGFQEDYEIVIEPPEEEDGKEDEEAKINQSKADFEGMPRRESLLKLAHSSVYSGQTIDKVPGDQKQGGKANSRGGTSYAPTDLGQDEITLEVATGKPPQF